MKIKIIVAVLVILILCLGVAVYANNNTKTSKVLFFSEVEQEDRNVTKSNMPKKTIINGAEEVQLEYKESKYDNDIYVSNKKDEYIYKNDNLIGFIKKVDDEINVTRMNSESAQEIANTFLQENIDESDKYELTSSNYITSYAEYSFVYNNKLNGIDTNDTVKINVNNNGEVVSFSNFNQGVFEKFSGVKVNMEIIEKEIIDSIKNKYGKDYVDSEIIYSFFNIVNDKLVLQVNVSIEVANQVSSSVLDTIIYELN